MKVVLRLRPLEWFFRKDWYGIRKGTTYDGERYFLVDIGALTFGIRI